MVGYLAFRSCTSSYYRGWPHATPLVTVVAAPVATVRLIRYAKHRSRARTRFPQRSQAPCWVALLVIDSIYTYNAGGKNGVALTQTLAESEAPLICSHALSWLGLIPFYFLRLSLMLDLAFFSLKFFPGWLGLNKLTWINCFWSVEIALSWLDLIPFYFLRLGLTLDWFSLVWIYFFEAALSRWTAKARSSFHRFLLL